MIESRFVQTGVQLRWYVDAIVDLDWSSASTLAAFHRGDRAVMEQCYRDHFDDVMGATARPLKGADRENVAHEVFERLLSNESFRRGFQGGSLGAWLYSVTTHQAFDYLRRHRREVSVPIDEIAGNQPPFEWEDRAVAREWVAKFRQQKLPAKWAPVFEACFVERLDQRSAAARLGIARTTLAYQWVRLKWLLEAFMLEGQP